MALVYSSFVLPLPPWNTRNLSLVPVMLGGGGLQRFRVFAVEFLFCVFLVFAEEFGVETDVARFVYAVNVSETCSDGEVGSYFCECGVHVPDIFGLSIQSSVIHSRVVDTYPQSHHFSWSESEGGGEGTIFFTTGDSDFHFKPLFHGDSTFKVLLCQCDILIFWFFGKINHVRTSHHQPYCIVRIST